MTDTTVVSNLCQQVDEKFNFIRITSPNDFNLYKATIVYIHDFSIMPL